MVAELATLLVYRTSGRSEAIPEVPDDARPIGTDPVIVLHPTPAAALRFAREVLDVVPHATVAIDVGELEGDSGAVVDRVVSLATAGGPGEILVTDVVRQLCSPSESFEAMTPRGLLGVGDGRTHRLAGTNRRPPGPPTVGRDVELASVDWVIEELADGSGRALAIEGEPGIGKSHLVSVAASRAEAMGATVLRAEADELQPSRPGLLLGRLLQQLDSATNRVDPGPAAVDDFCDRLERAAAGTPLLVLAEDLQWADPLTLRAIAAAARVIGPLPIALVVDFRPSPRPALLGPLLDVLGRAGAEHHVLEPLDPEATSSMVAALLGAAPGPALRARMLATAGNPLFVSEMLQALRNEHALHLDNGIVDTDRADVPTRLRDTVLRRVDSLPERTKDALLGASLLGSTFDLADLERTIDREADVLEDVLRPAVDARLLDPTPRGFAFRHDLVRDAVYESMPEPVRARRHREVGWALASGDAEPVVVASQLVLGDQPSDVSTLEWIERAARQAREVDPGSASQLYELLLERAPMSWEGRDLAETALVDVLAATGRVDDAIERAGLLLHRQLEEHSEWLARTGLVAAHATRGHLAQAAAEADRAAKATSDQRRERLLRCIASSMRYFDGGSSEELTGTAEALLTIDDDESVAWAQQALGLVAMGDGRYEDSRRHMVESSRRLDRTPLPDLGFLIPHVHAATMLAYLDDFDAQLTEMAVVIDRWSARGEQSRLVLGHICLTNRAYFAGDLDSAAAEAEATLAVGAETGAGAMTAPAHAILALVAMARGDLDMAERHVSSGFEFLLSGAHRFGAELLVLAHARLSQRRGDPATAAQALQQFWEEAGDRLLAFQHRNLVPEIVRLRTHGMPSEVVTAAAEAARDAAERTPIDSTIACSLRCRALIDQDPDLILEAVDRYRRSPRLVEYAETLEDAATITFERGRIDDGVRLADAAVTGYHAMGATADADRVAALIRTQGIPRRRDRPGATHGWESLTRKELEVADLVGNGLSNPEIADRLYISRRTVESHLSHIFTKLDISNRSKLTAIVVERRSSPDP